jgi:DNA-directed RNA polymerase III subunit RPC3
VQHNILFHAQTEDDGEVLEVNVDECLMRLRFGRFVRQAEESFGRAVCKSTSEFICRSDCALSQGAEIVQLILDHGKLRPPDIMSQLSTSDPKGD